MRFLLKKTLQYLSAWAIRKHKLELIVITGDTGVEIVREGIYSILSQKYIVRRNIKSVWWDLSIPLNILGYTDETRSLFSWIILIFRATIYLLYGPKNPHTLILSAQSGLKETAEYWSEFIKPNFLVIVDDALNKNVSNYLRKATIEKNGVIITENSEFENNSNTFLFGKNKSSKVTFQVSSDKILVQYNKFSISVPRFFFSPSSGKYIAGIVSLCISKGMAIDDIAIGLSKFDMKSEILKKISTKIIE